MMADFVAPRHSAVMERLRRRIELFRRHHTSCENRYDNTAMERLELDQQQTFALHQRCLQTKAKRSNKHRQPQPTTDQTGLRPAGTGGATSDPSDNASAESRNNPRIVESVKRKLEAPGSPLCRDQVNGYRDGYPPSKKASLEDVRHDVNGTANGALPPLSPHDTKHPAGLDSQVSNGARAAPGSEQNGTGLSESGPGRSQEGELRLKQEPVEDIFPCMLPSGGSMGNSNLLPDLHLNEQEWKELMEELSVSVAYEDMQDIFNDSFEDRKDPDIAAATTGLSGPLSADPVSVKAEFSPAQPQAPPTFEQAPPPSSSPQLRLMSSGTPVASVSPATSTPTVAPSVGPSQPQRLPPQSRLLPASSPKDLSPAQQLQQLAAREQQRAQLMQTQSQLGQKQLTQSQLGQKQLTQSQLGQKQLTQSQLGQKQLTQSQLAQAQMQKQQQQQQQAAKFHAPSSQPSWSQAAPSQSSLTGPYGQEKPSSPALYQQDFPNGKQLLMPAPPQNKGSPKAGAGPYMQQTPHPNMLNHPPPNMLNQNQATGQPSLLDYANTKPLSHYDLAQGPTPAQSKAALLSLIRQQPMKPKAAMPFRQHPPHAQQEQNAYAAGAHIPGPPATMATQPPGNGMGGNHGNAAYISSQALKQQQQMQILEAQKQFLMGQRQQQIMAEQPEQQLQRHLTRPPPQYQDQQNSQHAFQQQQQQQQVNQFTGSSQSLGTVGLPCGSAPGGQRIFPQAQSMMGMGVGQTGGPGGVAPPAPSQADMANYNSNMSLHAHPVQAQRAPTSAMPAAYRQNQNLLAQQHIKNQPNAALLKQQQQQMARMPTAMPTSHPNTLPNSLSNSLPSSVPMQTQTWQQQQQHPAMQQAMAAQSAAANGSLQSFGNPAFHTQPRLPKLPSSASFSQAGMNSGRPLGTMNSAQMMPGLPQQRTNPALAPQPHPQQQNQPLAPPPQQQNQQVMSSVNLPDLGAFGQAQSGQMTNRASMQCNQGYPVPRTANQDLPFGFNAQSGNGLPSFPGESDLMETLLKNQTTQDWMDDLDELLANHQ